MTSIVERLLDEIADVPIVDAHCHPFVLERVGADLPSSITLSDDPETQRSLGSTLLTRRLVRDLATFLDCAPTPAAVTDARRRAIEGDRDGYIASLLDDAGIEQLLCDTGHPLTDDGRPAVDLSAFEAAVARPCPTVFRIDTVVDRWLAAGVPFEELVDLLAGEVEEAVAAGAVAFKSIIAYRTGLDVELASAAEARASHDRVRAGGDASHSGGDARVDKPLRDFLFVWSVQAAMRHDVPLQVHAGMGDGPIFDLTLARPALLRRVLMEPSLRDARIVLTHAGYPWVEETGWLANQYEHVFVDLSEMVPFASSGVGRKLLGLLEMAPTSKLLYGSDGFNMPELFWFGAHVGRHALADALGTLVAEQWLAEPEAIDVAEAILRRNAIDLYRLTGPSAIHHDGTHADDPRGGTSHDG